jgi:hypothetical protein
LGKVAGRRENGTRILGKRKRDKDEDKDED